MTRHEHFLSRCRQEPREVAEKLVRFEEWLEVISLRDDPAGDMARRALQGDPVPMEDMA